MFCAVYANQKGNIYEDAGLGMLGRSGGEWLQPEPQEMMPLPAGASLVSIPGVAPVGLNAGGEAAVVQKGQEVQAVAALLPQGFTRTLLPAYAGTPGKVVPLYGYAAVGFKHGRFYTAAIQSARHHKWHPRYYHTETLCARISAMLKRFPDNRIIRQVARCSLEYGCFTAQNFFYRRWEAGIPTYQPCNADCIGCISESHIDSLASPQQRMTTPPTLEEIAEMGRYHLEQARDAIISFGQGCEGEPALNARRLAPAIAKIRSGTDRGTININTNAGYTEGIRLLADAGLDSMRVTLFSAREKNYSYYHRPAYGLEDVCASITYAKERRVKVALNLLVFPGITDLETETEALILFLRRYEIDMVQLRNLNMDPDLLWQGLPEGKDAPALGITGFVAALREELPGLEIGSYSTPRT
jgi:wyosine [tRNA(Phe)-imidazoG37] synthetase (radical SAM superfamily)